MAEDRERFRALLDRIGQPYAPSWIVEGATAEERDASADAALARSACPAIVRPAFTLGGTGGGIVETEPAYRERVRAGLRASPIGQVMVERCLVGWQEIEYEVMRDADDTCIAVCSMENVDPLGVHTGDSIVVAPVQTLPDPVHQRLRSAALAIIRALGVEGGCNVQFALCPDYEDYAVIEVNPRVSRSSALATKATGYPIARVAAQIAVGPAAGRDPERGHRHDGRRLRAGARLRGGQAAALPVRQVPDRRPLAGQPDEGDRRGDGDRPHVRRGAQQGAPWPRAGGCRAAGRGSRLGADASTTSPRSTLRRRRDDGGPPDEDPADEDPADDDAPIAGETPTGRPASRRATPSAPRRRSSCAASSPRPTPGCGGSWRSCAAACPRGRASMARPASPRGSSPSWTSGRARARRGGARPAAGGRGRRRRPLTLLATAKRAGFGDRDLATLAGLGHRRRCARRAIAIGLRPGFAMVDTCAAEFAAETPYFYATYAAAGSPPEAPPVARPAALVIGSGPVRIGQGIEFDYCAVQAAESLRAAGLVGGDDQLEPRDGVDRLRRVHPAVLRAARSRDRAAASSRRRPARRGAAARPSSSSAARRRSTSPRRSPQPASRSSGPTSRPSTRPRSGPGSRRCSTGSASRSPRAAWPTASRRR